MSIAKKIGSIAVGVAIASVLAGCASNDQEAPSPEAPAQESQQESASLSDRLSSEPGTTARIDEIASLAKSDSADASDSEKSAAVSFIAENYTTCLDSTEAMEQMMYYGGVLDYSYEDGTIESDLGTDAVQLVKYVYRGAETADDDATKENMRQVQEGVAALGL